MLSDVLSVLTCLGRALQAKTADFALVASQPADLAIGVVDLETAREHFNKNVLALPGRGQQANQLSFQRYLGPLHCFQHLRSTEMPNRCPAAAQIWHCRIGEAPKILWGDN